MLPSLGFGEFIVLALLAIIVVGPKDLPKLMRTLGQIMGRIRAMGQEFKDAFNDMDADAEVAAMRAEIEALKRLGHFDDIDDDLSDEIHDMNREMRELGNDIRDDVTEAVSDKAKPTPANPKKGNAS